MALPSPVNGIPGTDAPFDVVDMLDRPGRFEIVDKESGEIIDNANGYGYKTKTNAYKAGWFKFGGGKKKIDDAVSWWHMPEHREFRDYLSDWKSQLLCECRDTHQPTANIGKYLAARAADYAREHGIEDYKPEYFKSWDKAL